MRIIQTIAIVLTLSLFATMAFGQIKVVAPNGDVGIGTSTPLEKLEVNGGILLGNTTNTNAGTIRYSGSDLEGYVGGAWTSLTAAGGGGTGGSIWTETGSTAVYSGNAEVVGNVFEVGSGAGTTTAQLKVGGGRSADGTASFDLIGDVVDYPGFGFRFQRFGNGQTTMIHKGDTQFVIRNDDSADFSIWTEATMRMKIRDNGNVGIGFSTPTVKLQVAGDVQATAFNVASDRRLKSNIRDFDMGLEQVLNLRPVTYEYNGKGGITSTRNHVGLIAQELAEVAPALVEEFLYIEEDENQVRTLEEEYLRINDSEIKYLLVNAIQEQQELINEKDDQIQDLNERLIALEESFENISEGTAINSTITLSHHDIAELKQNAPNPFNGETTIQYVIPTNAKTAKLNIFNSSGILIKSVNISHVGEGSVTVKAQEIPSGVYAYQLVIDDSIVSVNSMILQR